MAPPVAHSVTTGRACHPVAVLTATRHGRGMASSPTSATPADRPRALLLDVDGTLVDSTYLHVSTWHRALDEAGATVPHVEVHRRVGKDGATLVAELLEVAGVDDDENGGRIASRAKDLQIGRASCRERV